MVPQLVSGGTRICAPTSPTPPLLIVEEDWRARGIHQTLTPGVLGGFAPGDIRDRVNSETLSIFVALCPPKSGSPRTPVTADAHGLRLSLVFFLGSLSASHLFFPSVPQPMPLF